MNETVLVTGGAGYLGSILCERLLQEGFGVICLDNLSLGQSSLFHLCAHERFDFIRADARDERVMAQVLPRADAVIPLAAIVGAPACDRAPWDATTINVDAARLVDRLRSKAQKVVYPTTNSGYGTQSGDQFCTEETPLEPISLYGRTKVEAEKLFLDTGEAVTFRLATVFGISPRMRLDLLVNHFVYAAVTDGYLVLFEKHFKRNFIHVRDVADAFLHALNHYDAMKGKPYNAGLDAANVSKEELALKVKEHVPNFYLHFAEVGSDPDKRNYVVSNQRLREAGFTAKRGLDEGIRELLKGYRMMARSAFKNV
jgi:nucleoside-diphosphate-sugar epimerase